MAFAARTLSEATDNLFQRPKIQCSKAINAHLKGVNARRGSIRR